MTCKDCIHERVCNALIVQGLPYNDDKLPAEAFCMTFKDKSRFVELPCNANDTVYVIQNNTIIQSYIIQLKYEQEAENYGKFVRNRIYTVIGNVLIEFDFSDFGKSVFLTREEAEKALERIEGND